MTRKYVVALFQAILILAAGVLAVWITSLFTKPTLPKDIVREVVVTKPSCPATNDDYLALVAKGQVVPLLSGVKSHAENNRFVPERTVTVTRTGSGSEVACGYLYAAVSVDRQPLRRPYETIYINPDDFGGHLDWANAIVDKDDQRETELLFDLTKMTYTDSSKLNYAKNQKKDAKASAPLPESVRVADWASLFNVSNIVKFRIGIATTRQGTIRNLVIAYRCWNPQTGKVGYLSPQTRLHCTY